MGKWDQGEWKVPVVIHTSARRRITKDAARRWLEENPPDDLNPPSFWKTFRKTMGRLFGIGPDHREPPMDPLVETTKTHERVLKLAMRAYCKAILDESGA